MKVSLFSPRFSHYRIQFANAEAEPRGGVKIFAILDLEMGVLPEQCNRWSHEPGTNSAIYGSVSDKL